MRCFWNDILSGSLEVTSAKEPASYYASNLAAEVNLLWSGSSTKSFRMSSRVVIIAIDTVRGIISLSISLMDYSSARHTEFLMRLLLLLILMY